MIQIKQLQPKEGVTLLAVKVPGNSFNYVVRQNEDQSDLWYESHYGDDDISSWIELPEGNWQLLGIATEIPEEVWRELFPAPDPYDARLFKNFIKEGGIYPTATESAMSFLEANEVYSKNPYGEKPINVGGYFGSDVTVRNVVSEQQQRYRLWQQAEANTGTRLILIPQD